MQYVIEVLEQVVSGRDFDTPEALLRSVKPDVAAMVVPGSPYSIATNVAHADIWNLVWLAKLEGKPRLNPFPDFPVIPAEDWKTVRKQFLENLDSAIEIASRKPFTHAMKSDESAAKTLLQIAVHTAYHLGQVKLLKRIARSTKISS